MRGNVSVILVVMGLMFIAAIFWLLTGCASVDTNYKYKFTPPSDITGRQCAVQCQILNNSCVQLEIEKAKMFVVGNDKSQWALYMSRVKCDNDFRQCYQDCGGKVVSTK